MAAQVETLPNNEILSFDRHLKHAFTLLSRRLERGVEGFDCILELLRQRIELDAQFAKGLEKIVSDCNFGSMETGTIHDAFDAIKADMKNEMTIRTEFVNSLVEDVYTPLTQMKHVYNARNITFAQNTKSKIKSFRSEQLKFENATRDAQNARSSLLDARADKNISAQQIIKLQQSTKEKFELQKLISESWNREQINFDLQMNQILQGMENNEESRLKTLCDSFTKWAVFVTNLTANRNYDVKSLAETMSLISPKDDLQQFMRETLDNNPPKFSTKLRVSSSNLSLSTVSSTSSLFSDKRRNSRSISKSESEFIYLSPSNSNMKNKYSPRNPQMYNRRQNSYSSTSTMSSLASLTPYNSSGNNSNNGNNNSNNNDNNNGNVHHSKDRSLSELWYDLTKGNNNTTTNSNDNNSVKNTSPLQHGPKEPSGTFVQYISSLVNA